MKRIYFRLFLLIAMVNTLVACQTDPEFPDPGFDMLADKQISLRRDTAEFFTLRLNVNAPAGIDVIQILNGRSFNVLDELHQYDGETRFPFEYKIDFKEIDPTRDTVLVYNLRILSRDNRAYNSSFKISLYKLSIPEIELAHNDVLGVVSPVVGIRGKISTSLNTLTSVKIYIGEEEKYVVNPEEITGLHEYQLDARISYPFQEGMEYPLRLEMIDSKGQVVNKNITVKGVRLKKPVRILAKSRNDYVIFNFEYDEADRIKSISFGTLDEFWTDQKAEFFYNQRGQVERYQSVYVAYPDEYSINYNYDGNGRLISIVSEGVIGEEVLDNFRYDEDGCITAFMAGKKAGTSLISDIPYVDGFISGEKIFAEVWPGRVSQITSGNRRMKKDFSPILMPTYIEGLPPVAYIPDDDYFWGWFNILFCYKYINENDASGVGNTEPEGTYFTKYTYTINDDGQLESLIVKPNPNSYYWFTMTFEY